MSDKEYNEIIEVLNHWNDEESEEEYMNESERIGIYITEFGIM